MISAVLTESVNKFAQKAVIPAKAGMTGCVQTNSEYALKIHRLKLNRTGYARRTFLGVQVRLPVSIGQP